MMRTIWTGAEITDYTAFQMLLAQHERVLLYVSSDTCGVCEVLWQKTLTFLEKYPDLPVCQLSAEEHPEIMGQLVIFSAPTLVIFRQKQEVHRQSRFIDFAEVEQSLYFHTIQND